MANKIEIMNNQCAAFHAAVVQARNEIAVLKKMNSKALRAHVQAQKSFDVSHMSREQLIMIADDGRIEMRKPEGFDAWFNKNVSNGKRASRFSANDIAKMRAMREAGQSFKSIAVQFDCSHVFVRNVIIGNVHKNS